MTRRATTRISPAACGAGRHESAPAPLICRAQRNPADTPFNPRSHMLFCAPARCTMLQTHAPSCLVCRALGTAEQTRLEINITLSHSCCNTVQHSTVLRSTARFNVDRFGGRCRTRAGSSRGTTHSRRVRHALSTCGARSCECVGARPGLYGSCQPLDLENARWLVAADTQWRASLRFATAGTVAVRALWVTVTCR